MGCGMSTEEKEGKARNEEIENQLKRDRMQQRNEIKMLLLGMFYDSTVAFPLFQLIARLYLASLVRFHAIPASSMSISFSGQW